MILDTQHFKKILEEEVQTLENELSTIGRKNPTVKGDWEAVEPEDDRDRADETEVADGIGNLENNTSVLNTLEERLREVKSALESIESGTYGSCRVCGEAIEEERLSANPAATTCVLHMNA